MGWRRREFTGQSKDSLWNDRHTFDSMVEAGLTHIDQEGRPVFILKYSTDIAAAWQVVERLFGIRPKCQLVFDDGEWSFTHWNDDEAHFGLANLTASGPAMPLAVCRAGLKALFDPTPQEQV
jgi:hypothetical protein